MARCDPTFMEAQDGNVHCCGSKCRRFSLPSRILPLQWDFHAVDSTGCGCHNRGVAGVNAIVMDISWALIERGVQSVYMV